MRVLTLDTGKVETFGPLESGCDLRWDTANRFWMFARGREFTGWTEFDLTTRRATGRREAMTLDPLWACPEYADPENPD